MIKLLRTVFIKTTKKLFFFYESWNGLHSWDIHGRQKPKKRLILCWFMRRWGRWSSLSSKTVFMNSSWRWHWWGENVKKKKRKVSEFQLLGREKKSKIWFCLLYALHLRENASRKLVVICFPNVFTFLEYLNYLCMTFFNYFIIFFIYNRASIRRDHQLSSNHSQQSKQSGKQTNKQAPSLLSHLFLCCSFIVHTPPPPPPPPLSEEILRFYIPLPPSMFEQPAD